MPNSLQKPTLRSLPEALFLLVLLGLTLYSFRACAGPCSALAAYKIAGVSFPVFGLLFFALLSVSVFFFRTVKYTFWLVLMGMGAESHFLSLQIKLGKFCPTCVTLATVLALYGTYVQRQYFREQKERATAEIAVFCLIGLLVAVFTVRDTSFDIPVKPAAPSVNMKTQSEGRVYQDIWYGNLDSEIEVIFVSDWYCSFCQKSETLTTDLLPALGKQYKYTFIDMPVHEQSKAFLPYSMTLQLTDKYAYLLARPLFFDMAASGEPISPAQISSTLLRNGIQVTPDIEGITVLAEKYKTIIRQAGVNSTPSVIVRNGKGVSSVLNPVEGFDLEAVSKAAQTLQ
ncbi:MAG: thioredoxin domain-containing protein [Trichlorobacter sp.]|nr:thioredoxin domain-containing protein [Trichlorobacter sp.]